MSKQKTGDCQCGATLTMPNAECLYHCRQCDRTGLFLCHPLPLPKDPVNIRCKKCKQRYGMFTCPQCKGTAVMKDFQSGSIYGCVCGFQSTMITCNACMALLCLPPSKDYQNTLITCKKCQNVFKYGLCPACSECIYLKPNQTMADVPFCFNPKCARSPQQQQQSTHYSQHQQVQAPAQQSGMNVAQYPPVESVFVPESERCKACNRSKMCMINTTCFHMTVCESCSHHLNGQCPTCGAKGEFRKVER